MEAGSRRFVLRHLLGRGGFGEVYRATMTTPGGLAAEVAVKLLRLDQGARDEAVRRLRDEGRLLSALQHPAILRAWDLAMLDGRVALVTEFVDGQDLGACTEPDAPDRIPPRALVGVVAQVAEGLEAAWAAPRPGSDEPMRIVHRDIKPSNLRIARHGQTKILDFGIARADNAEREAHTGSHSALGSLAYMAPERFGRRPAGPECDVYSLGCVLFEGLTGVRLHPEAVPLDMMALASDAAAWEAHVDRALAALSPDLPAELATLLRETLAHDPTRRPTTREVAERCEDLAAALPGAPLKRWARERRWPEPETLAGPLDGRALTDGTVDTASPLARDPSSDTFQFDGAEAEALPVLPSGAPPVVGRDRRLWVRLAGVLALAGCAALVAWAVWRAGAPPARAPVAELPRPAPIAAPAPATVAPPPAPPPTPAPAAPAAPAAPPVQRPSVPTPPPERTPAPVPEPPVPAPEPPPLPPGRVKVSGATLVAVEIEGRKVPPDAVPPHRAAYVHVTFGADAHSLGPYLLSPGASLLVTCVPMTQRCTVE